MKIKACAAICLCLIMLFPGCSAGGTSGSAGTPGFAAEQMPDNPDVEVWGAAGTEKILRETMPEPTLQDVRREAAVKVFAARGESEGCHIILTSKNSGVYGINLESCELKSGNDTFLKSNVKVFFEKYLNVTRIYDGNGAPKGHYPDALVPMDAIIARGENRMDKNSNQGLYVRFDIPKDQPAGIYTGTMKLHYAKKTQDIPVSLEILNLTISEETHSRSTFLHDWYFRIGELDTTQAMLEKYVAAGLEYRISPGNVVLGYTFDDEGIRYYADTAAKFMRNPKCTYIMIPFAHKTIDGQNVIDPDVFNKVLHVFADKSFEDNFNYIRKLGTHLVDEPQLNNKLGQTRVMTRVFYQTLEKTAAELEAERHENAALKAELAESVRNLRAVITASYDPDYEGYIRTWCPTVDYYDTKEARDIYEAEQERYYPGHGEQWWYTCISPRAPFPTYHIEDTLLSARTMGWMQSEYDVTGNLFWATSVYAEYDGQKYVNIEDFYTGNASRFPSVNGDGFLFYPGKPYGIDGPVGSLRLEAIRDGLEEYELMYDLKNSYAKVSEKIKDVLGREFDAKTIIHNLSSSLYNGTRVSATSSGFDEARRALYELAAMNNSSAEFAVIDVADDNHGNISYEFFANGGYGVYRDGSPLSAVKDAADGKIYRINNSLSEDKNTLTLRIKNEDEEFLYKKYLGGKATVYTPADLKDAFESEHAKVTAGLEDGGGTGQAQVLKLTLGSTSAVSQRIISEAGLFKSRDANAKRMVMNIYSGEDAGIPFEVSVRMTKGKYNVALVSADLHKGWNTVSIPLENINFRTEGSIERLLFLFGDTDDMTAEPERTFRLGDLVIYNK